LAQSYEKFQFVVTFVKKNLKISLLCNAADEMDGFSCGSFVHNRAPVWSETVFAGGLTGKRRDNEKGGGMHINH
jgi:hypothetical protein